MSDAEKRDSIELTKVYSDVNCSWRMLCARRSARSKQEKFQSAQPSFATVRSSDAVAIATSPIPIQPPMPRSSRLREAGAALGNHRLEGCELFATIEPCAMCAGALVHARLKRLVYGADDPKAGAVRSVMQVLNHPSLNHRMEVRSGVLAGRCAEIVTELFSDSGGKKSRRSPVLSRCSDLTNFLTTGVRRLTTAFRRGA